MHGAGVDSDGESGLVGEDVDGSGGLPIRGSGSYRVSAYRTHGYKTRRMAIDNGIPLITDIKCAKLFITALQEMRLQNLQLLI